MYLPIAAQLSFERSVAIGLSVCAGILYGSS